MKRASSSLCLGLAFILLGLLGSGCSSNGAAPASSSADNDDTASAGSLLGHVIVPGGQADSAVVSAQPDSGVPVITGSSPYAATTDSTGAFRIDDVPEGRYVLVARSGDLAGVLPGVWVSARAPTTITIHLTPTGELSGKATLGATSGNAGILVWVAGTSLVAVTHDDGSYIINGVPVRSSYTVMATRPGYSVGQQTSLSVSAGVTTTVPDIALTQTDNHIPQISTLSADPITVEQSGTCTLSVEAEDQDGDPLAFAWSAADGLLSSESGNPVQWTPPSQDGSYAVTVIVNDGNGGSASGAVAVLVSTPPTPNQKPTITSMTPDDTPDVGVGEPQAVSVVASDPDSDPLTYAWSATGGFISGSGASVTWNAPLTAGTFMVSCVVADGRGGSAQESVNFTVSELNVILW